MKNYFIYLIICIFTFLLLFIFINKEISNNSGNNILSKYVYNLNGDNFLDNLKNYSLDNNQFVLYISIDKNNEFNNEFKDYIVNNNLKEKIVYLKLYKNYNNSYLKDFKNIFFDENIKNIDLQYLNQSNLYFFENGKVVDILYKSKKSINTFDVKNYINGLGDYIND